MRAVPPRPAALLLDIGGTILCEESYDLAAGLQALRPRGDAETLIRDLQDSIDEVHRSNSAEFTLSRWLADNRRAFAKQGSVLELELALFRATARLRPMRGVAEALVTLSDAGLALGCISNAVFSGRVLSSELERHGLRTRLSFVISSADLEIRKPDSRIFLAGVSMLGLAASSTWFVGDSWAADVQGAVDSGLFPIWLSPCNAPPRPEANYVRVEAPELCSLVTDSIAS